MIARVCFEGYILWMYPMPGYNRHRQVGTWDSFKGDLAEYTLDILGCLPEYGRRTRVYTRV